MDISEKDNFYTKEEMEILSSIEKETGELLNKFIDEYKDNMNPSEHDKEREMSNKIHDLVNYGKRERVEIFERAEKRYIDSVPKGSVSIVANNIKSVILDYMFKDCLYAGDGKTDAAPVRKFFKEYNVEKNYKDIVDLYPAHRDYLSGIEGGKESIEKFMEGIRGKLARAKKIPASQREFERKYSLDADSINPSLFPREEMDRCLSRYSRVPSSAALHLMSNTLAYGNKRLQKMPERINKLGKRNKSRIGYANGGKNVHIGYENNKSNFIVHIDDIDILSKGSKPARKLFIFFLAKINEILFSSNERKIVNDVLWFSLQEMVDLGMYTSKRSADIGFKKAAEALLTLSVDGILSYNDGSGMRTIEIKHHSLLFTSHGEQKHTSNRFIMLNSVCPWECICDSFYLMPKWAYGMSTRAFMLMRYISYLSRINVKHIAKNNYMHVSFRAIQNTLNLPDDKGIINAQREIKDEIERAISEINEYPGNDSVFIELECDNASVISKYLDTGKMRVAFTNEYMQYMIDTESKYQQKIHDHERRLARTRDKALEKVMVKRIEASASKVPESESLFV